MNPDAPSSLKDIFGFNDTPFLGLMDHYFSPAPKKIIKEHIVELIENELAKINYSYRENVLSGIDQMNHLFDLQDDLCGMTMLEVFHNQTSLINQVMQG